MSISHNYSDDTLGNIAEIVNITGDYTVPDNGKSYLIFADTSSNAINVTLPTGAVNVSIKVIDAGENAGTNIITLVGTIDGATNDTIQTDGASREVAWSNTAWETSGGVGNLFKRDATTGVISPRSPDTFQAQAITGGNSGSLSDQSVADGDFSDLGANVDDSVSGHYSNDVIVGSDLTTPSTPISLVLGSASFGTLASSIIDNSSGTSLNTGSSTNRIRLDLGTSKTLKAITSNQYPGFLNNFEVWVSPNEITDYIKIADIDVSGDTAQTENLHTFGGNTDSGRYVELRNSTGRFIMYEIQLLEGTYADVLNTFVTALPVAEQVPASIKYYDENNALITGTGKVNIEYNVDGAGFLGEIVQRPEVYPSSNSNGSANTGFKELSDMGLTGTKSISSVIIDAKTGTESVEYFHATPNGSNWDIVSLGSESSQAFVSGTPHEFSFTAVEMNCDTDLVGVSFAGNGSDIRYQFGTGMTQRYIITSITGDSTDTTLLPFTLANISIAVKTSFPYDLQDFKALANLVPSSSLVLRTQLVGAQIMKRLTINTPNSVLKANSTGALGTYVDDVLAPTVFLYGVNFPSYTTSQRDALTGMIAGTMVFNSTTGNINQYSGSAWSDGNTPEFVGTESYSPEDADDLETDFPAADNAGMYANIWTGTAIDGMYRSVSGVWTKVMDDSGDRTNLWDYAAGLTYGTTNLITNSGTLKATENDGTTDITPTDDIARAFSYAGNVFVGCYPTNFGSFNVFKLFDTVPPSSGKFQIHCQWYYSSTAAVFGLKEFKIIGIDAANNITVLNPTTVTGDVDNDIVIVGTSIKRTSGLGMSRISATVPQTLTIETSNTTRYKGYGVRIMDGGTTVSVLSGIKIFESYSATTDIDAVRSINKLYNGATVSHTTAERDALTSVAAGTTIFNSTTSKLNFYTGSAWSDGNTPEFVGGAAYSPADPDALETDHPAANNSGLWAVLWAGTSKDGIYRSNGTTWVKQADTVGDLSDLFDYAGGIAHSGDVSDLRGASGSNDLTRVDTGASVGTAVSAFDGNLTSEITQFSGVLPSTNVRVEKTLAVADAYARFTVTASDSYSTANQLKDFKLEGYDGSAWDELNVVSVSGDGSFSNNTVSMDAGTSNSCAVTTSNTTEYSRYALRMINGQSGTSGIIGFCEFEGETATDNTNLVTPVASINKLYNGATVSHTTAERDALTSVAAGTTIFNSTTSKLNFYTGSAWEAVTSS